MTTTKEYITPKEASKLTGLHTATLRTYADKGIVEVQRFNGGRRRYEKNSLIKMLGVETTPETKTAFYIRSSNGNETLMQTQHTLLENKLGTPVKIYRDKASGLNEKRRGLQQLMKDAKTGNITHVAVTDKDRLTRFGFYYLEQYFNMCNVEVIVINATTNKTMHEELIEDFLSLLASFSGKYYRLRGYENQKKFLNNIKEALDEQTEKSD